MKTFWWVLGVIIAIILALGVYLGIQTNWQFNRITITISTGSEIIGDVLSGETLSGDLLRGTITGNVQVAGVSGDIGSDDIQMILQKTKENYDNSQSSSFISGFLEKHGFYITSPNAEFAGRFDMAAYYPDSGKTIPFKGGVAYSDFTIVNDDYVFAIAPEDHKASKSKGVIFSLSDFSIIYSFDIQNAETISRVSLEGAYIQGDSIYLSFPYASLLQKYNFKTNQFLWSYDTRTPEEKAKDEANKNASY